MPEAAFAPLPLSVCGTARDNMNNQQHRQSSLSVRCCHSAACFNTIIPTATQNLHSFMRKCTVTLNVPERQSCCRDRHNNETHSVVVVVTVEDSFLSVSDGV